MRLSYSALAVPCVWVTTVIAVNTLAKRDDANHIFNAIHSSMRQWGSSWHHNGMSFFLAEVPASTQFYHGTGSPDAVTGMEWLAFEPEHALVFAHVRDQPPGNKPPHLSSRSVSMAQRPLSMYSGEQDDSYPSKPPPSRPGQPRPHPPPRQWKPGYLHTYLTHHSLSLLYVDGQSGGKSTIGTLDSQDILILNRSTSISDPGMGESARASDLCALVHSKWGNKVDGILRMEAGFEIILCDFEKHLRLVDVVRAGGDSTTGSWTEVWNWFSAITARYNGIGGDRVKINYDQFVTAYGRDLGLFAGQDLNISSPLPRLQNASTSDLDIVRRDIDDLILRRDRAEAKSLDWQAKTDMIVMRYSNLILQLLTIQNITMLQTRVANSLRPFINSEDRNITAEIERCAHQFLPYHSRTSKTGSFPLAYTSLLTVSTQICSTLCSLLPTSRSSVEDMNISSAHDSLQALIRYLDWSTFADCPQKCAPDEICLIPIWPIGGQKQRNQGHGECASSDHMGERDDYWRDGRGQM